jgi:hypothetical protein
VDQYSKPDSELRGSAPDPTGPGMEHFPDHSCRLCIDHPSQARPGIHPFEDRLHVITVVENPLRWRSRYWNYWLFQQMVEKSGAILYTVEIAFGDRHFEVTQHDNPRHLQLSTRDEILHKENGINLGVADLLPKTAKKYAWIDADVQFTRPDWAQETLHLLEHYKVIQMFSHALDLGPNFEPLDLNESFVSHELDNPAPHLPENRHHPDHKHHHHKHHHHHHHHPYHPYPEGRKKYKLFHPGLAWAWRKEAHDEVGGLMDWVMGGSADHYMALALFNQISTKKLKYSPDHLNLWDFPAAYRDPVLEWQHRAERFIRRNVGVMPGTINHAWHGPKQLRQYLSRAKFLAQIGFNPVHHLKRDHQGLYQLHDDGSPNYVQIRDGLRQYSRLRDEDSNERQVWLR